MEKIRWGIIGAGTIASKFATDLKSSKHGALVAVASRSVIKAKAFIDQYGGERSYGSYEELYADREIDAVYVATPHNFHFENSKDAMLSGKAVLCEKPICINPKELEELVKISKETNQYLMEGMWTYFLPPVRKAVQWVKEGRIGDITHVKADFGFRAPDDPEGRLFNPDLAGGAMLDIGIYPIALNWLFMQNDPSSIKVMGQKAKTGVDLEAHWIFEYPHVTSTMSCTLQSDLPNHAYIIGREGYIALPHFWMSQEAILYHDQQVVEHFNKPRENTTGFEFEADAVAEDLFAGKKESEIMPLSLSMKLQEHIQAVLNQVV